MQSLTRIGLAGGQKRKTTTVGQRFVRAEQERSVLPVPLPSRQEKAKAGAEGFYINKPLDDRELERIRQLTELIRNVVHQKHRLSDVAFEIEENMKNDTELSALDMIAQHDTSYNQDQASRTQTVTANTGIVTIPVSPYARADAHLIEYKCVALPESLRRLQQQQQSKFIAGAYTPLSLLYYCFDSQLYLQHYNSVRGKQQNQQQTSRTVDSSELYSVASNSMAEAQTFQLLEKPSQICFAPAKNSFINAIDVLHIAVVAYAREIRFYAVETADKGLSSAIKFSDLNISVAVQESVTSIICSEYGRIYYGGSSGNVHCIERQAMQFFGVKMSQERFVAVAAKEKGFQIQRLWRNVQTARSVKQIVLDDTRGLLYALVRCDERNIFGIKHFFTACAPHQMQVEVYDLGETQTEFRLAVTITHSDFVRQCRGALERVRIAPGDVPQKHLRIKRLQVVPTHLSQHIYLTLITTGAVRAYLTFAPKGATSTTAIAQGTQRGQSLVDKSLLPPNHFAKRPDFENYYVECLRFFYASEQKLERTEELPYRAGQLARTGVRQSMLKKLLYERTNLICVEDRSTTQSIQLTEGCLPAIARTRCFNSSKAAGSSALLPPFLNCSESVGVFIYEQLRLNSNNNNNNNNNNTQVQNAFNHSFSEPANFPDTQQQQKNRLCLYTISYSSLLPQERIDLFMIESAHRVYSNERNALQLNDLARQVYLPPTHYLAVDNNSLRVLLKLRPIDLLFEILQHDTYERELDRYLFAYGLEEGLSHLFQLLVDTNGVYYLNTMLARNVYEHSHTESVQQHEKTLINKTVVVNVRSDAPELHDVFKRTRKAFFDCAEKCYLRNYNPLDYYPQRNVPGEMTATTFNVAQQAATKKANDGYFFVKAPVNEKRSPISSTLHNFSGNQFVRIDNSKATVVGEVQKSALSSQQLLGKAVGNTLPKSSPKLECLLLYTSRVLLPVWSRRLVNVQAHLCLENASVSNFSEGELHLLRQRIEEIQHFVRENRRALQYYKPPRLQHHITTESSNGDNTGALNKKAELLNTIEDILSHKQQQQQAQQYVMQQTQANRFGFTGISAAAAAATAVEPGGQLMAPGVMPLEQPGNITQQEDVKNNIQYYSKNKTQIKTDTKALARIEEFIEKVRQGLELVSYLNAFGLPKMLWLLRAEEEAYLLSARLCDLIAQENEELGSAIMKAVIQGDDSSSPGNSKFVYLNNFPMFFSRFDAVYVHAEAQLQSAAAAWPHGEGRGYEASKVVQVSNELAEQAYALSEGQLNRLEILYRALPREHVIHFLKLLIERYRLALLDINISAQQQAAVTAHCLRLIRERVKLLFCAYQESLLNEQASNTRGEVSQQETSQTANAGGNLRVLFQDCKDLCLCYDQQEVHAILVQELVYAGLEHEMANVRSVHVPAALRRLLEDSETWSYPATVALYHHERGSKHYLQASNLAYQLCVAEGAAFRHSRDSGIGEDLYLEKTKTLARHQVQNFLKTREEYEQISIWIDLQADAIRELTSRYAEAVAEIAKSQARNKDVSPTPELENLYQDILFTARQIVPIKQLQNLLQQHAFYHLEIRILDFNCVQKETEQVSNQTYELGMNYLILQKNSRPHEEQRQKWKQSILSFWPQLKRQERSFPLKNLLHLLEQATLHQLRVDHNVSQVAGTESDLRELYKLSCTPDLTGGVDGDNTTRQASVWIAYFIIFELQIPAELFYQVQQQSYEDEQKLLAPSRLNSDPAPWNLSLHALYHQLNSLSALAQLLIIRCFSAITAQQGTFSEKAKALALADYQGLYRTELKPFLAEQPKFPLRASFEKLIKQEQEVQTRFQDEVEDQFREWRSRTAQFQAALEQRVEFAIRQRAPLSSQSSQSAAMPQAQGRFAKSEVFDLNSVTAQQQQQQQREQNRAAGESSDTKNFHAAQGLRNGSALFPQIQIGLVRESAQQQHNARVRAARVNFEQEQQRISSFSANVIGSTHQQQARLNPGKGYIPDLKP